MGLPESLRQFFICYGLDKNYWIAFSGGLDSHVVLAICKDLRQDLAINLRAIHIDHGLSPHSRIWANHCARVCHEYGIEYVERHIDPPLNSRPISTSTEEFAREHRYAILAEYIGENDILLTAHHQDDQAETVLLQLLRGAGLKGLAAMPAVKSFARGLHCRPLLQFPRAELHQYAIAQKLKWVDDESNVNTKYTRNFIRHEIIPLLSRRWPTIQATIARSARHCAEAQAILEEFALEHCKSLEGTVTDTLSVSRLSQFPQAQQRLILRTWIQQRGLPMPDANKIESIQSTVLTAGWDRLPCVQWQGAEIRRYRDDLYLMAPLQEHNLQQTYQWNLGGPLVIPEIGTLQANPVKGRGLRANLQQVTVCFRQGGEMACIANRGRHSLKNLFQEWHVLPWERNRIPLIFIGETLVSAVGYFLDPDHAAKSDEMGWEIRI